MVKQLMASDFDEVIARTTQMWIDFFKKETGIVLEIEYLTDYHDMAGCFRQSVDLVSQVWNDFYQKNITQRSPVTEGCIDVLKKMNERNFNIEILTSRPSHCSTQITEYLEGLGLSFITKINCCNTFESTGAVSKGEVFNKMGAHLFVEDTFSNAVDVATVAREATIFLIDRPWNQQKIFHSNIIRVNDWYEIGKYLF